MSVTEKILLAAYDLEQGRGSPFAAEDLVLRAWELDKELFGLQGYSSQHPDSNRILSYIMGRKGLKAKGWIERVGEKQYRLTVSGSRQAERLGKRPDVASSRAGALARTAIVVLERMLKSPAFRKRHSREEGDIIFRDACSFWGISSYSDASALHNRFTEIQDVLKDLGEAITQSEEGVLQLPGMKVQVDAATVQALRETHELLRRQFFNELEVIGRRRQGGALLRESK